MCPVPAAGWVKLLILSVFLVSLFQELRKSKSIRLNSSHRDVLHTIAELQLPVESTASTAGVTLLPAATVEALLVDKRRLELVQPFKLALLKLASQVSGAQMLCFHNHMTLHRLAATFQLLARLNDRLGMGSLCIHKTLLVTLHP